MAVPLAAIKFVQAVNPALVIAGSIPIYKLFVLICDLFQIMSLMWYPHIPTHSEL
jgi:hypothetical protein